MAQAVRGGECAQGRAALIAGGVDDTIAAVSSGQPPAAIAIVRISGVAAMAAATALAGSLPSPRRAALRALRAADGDLLDRALVLTFPGPHSATGEDLVELHCHGGRAVVEAVERALIACPGVRRAEPGEFTRRALHNGRIDLSEAEGLADLLEAETEAQRRAALVAAEGQVGRALRGWVDRLAMLSARVEAAIDYAEEGEVEAEAEALSGLANEQRMLADEIAAVLGAPPVERWRDGIRIVVAGPPNAGKSTLVNLLGERDAAIVSPTAGTTRDRIEVSVRRGGRAYVLTDTAGLRRETEDPIERAGMDLTQQAMASADLILWLGDEPPPPGTVHLHARADLQGREHPPETAALAISSGDPTSIERLWSLIEQETASLVGIATLPLHQRQWSACEKAVAALRLTSSDLVLQAEQLRSATKATGEALGVDATEAMLDALFGRFCLGK